MNRQQSKIIQRLQSSKTFILNLSSFLGFFLLEYVAMVFIQGSVLFEGDKRYALLIMGLGLSYCFIRFGLKAIGRQKILSRSSLSLRQIKWPNFADAKVLIGAYLLGWSGMVIWNEIEVLFFYKLTHGTTENQAAIDDLMHVGGSYSLVMFSLVIVFLGPIMEEILFRGLFFRYFNSLKFPWLVVALSALTFGFYHLSSYSWVSLLDLPPYAIIGFALAYTYKKTGKLSSSIFIHVFHNGWIQIVSIIALLH
ncbi:CAAX amino terminal protease family protein [Fructobacillus pseudoficulneus]|uniref:CAAX amino terminal protease family protein n=1 Tax=Fructobacillus pseudoficulneus TaxID=220714 RepID=A0A3F3GXU9_9LACO|nr:type II CAAX endopeptidase family protein [Fructobacillus pseudoficulneus]GAP02912.1 CAAX amino terminal protease family protein [Fructobacillus pseudoficulneus]SEH46691.1 CAAX protease self-immunity [Fructobacillus pseudoficulneus]